MSFSSLSLASCCGYGEEPPITCEVNSIAEFSDGEWWCGCNPGYDENPVDPYGPCVAVPCKPHSHPDYTGSTDDPLEWDCYCNFGYRLEDPSDYTSACILDWRLAMAASLSVVAAAGVAIYLLKR